MRYLFFSLAALLANRNENVYLVCYEPYYRFIDRHLYRG